MLAGRVRKSVWRRVGSAVHAVWVEIEPVFRRDEAVALMFAVFDILVELRAIRRVLEDGGEEEEGLSK
jgi:hypothetical protein